MWLSSGNGSWQKQLAAQFVKHFSLTIQDFDFEVGSLVLVCNSHVEKELNHKTKPCFLGPMVVVHHTKGGAYILVELNGAISRLQYAAFQIIPYLARFPDWIPVTSLLDNAELEDVQLHLESFPPADELSDNHLSMNNLPHTTISSSLRTSFCLYDIPVKNGFSDLTKVQEGQDHQGKDVTDDRQGKALREGCCERR